MNRFALSASILALSAMSALAQSQPAATPATGATPPRPATAATAPTPAPVGAVTTSGARGSNIAATAADARTMANARVQAKELACRAKGAIYTFKPPHNVGDARPGGGFYTTNSGGSCRAMSLTDAVAKGLVTVKN